VKQRLGGAMRQSGVIAAMCLYALEHNVDRLAEDHALAAAIAGRIAQLPGVARVLPAPTNIVIFDLGPEAPDAATLVRLMRAEGVIVGQFGPRRIRVVAHRDVDAAAGEALCAGLARHLGGA
jgi:threonine aldolase